MSGSRISNPLTSIRSVVSLAILTAAAFGGSYYSIPLFFGVDFLLGSLAVLLAVRLYGTKLGTASAAAAGVLIFVIWHSPVTLVLYTCEALFVGLFLSFKDENILVVDVFFWVFAGIPLIWLIGYQVIKLDAQSTMFLYLKVSINSIFNAFLANLMIAYLPVYRWAGIKTADSEDRRLTLHQALFNLLVAFVILPAVVFMTMDNQREQKDTVAVVRDRIESASTQIIGQLLFWQQQHQHAVSELARIAGRSDMMPTKDLQKSTEDITRAFPDFLAMYIGSSEGTSIVFYPPTGAKGEATKGLNFSDRDYYKEVKNTRRSGMSEVFIGRANVPFPIVVLTEPVITAERFRGFALGALDLGYIGEMLKLNTYGGVLNATVVDRKEQIIASTNPAYSTMQTYKRQAGWTVQRLNATTYQLLPPPDKNIPAEVHWQNTLYVKELPVGANIPWRLVVEMSDEPWQNSLQAHNAKDLVAMLGLAVAAFLFASVLSRRFVGPLSKLALVTTDLPLKLFLQQHVEWPASPVTELDSLVGNFRSMSDTFQENFKELQAAILMVDEEEMKLEAIIAGIGDGISIIDSDYRVLYQNQIHVDLVGAHTGEKCYMAYQHKDEVCESCPVAASFKDGRVHRMERKTTTDRGTLYLEVTASPLKDAAGKIISGIEVVRDITDSKRVEGELREKQDRLEEQLHFANGLNRIAEIIVSDDDTENILKNMNTIVSETLGVDRSVIYYVQIESQTAAGLCDWYNPATSVPSTWRDHSLATFRASARYFWEHRRWMESHTDDVNPCFTLEGSAEILHKRMGIQSLLGFPFSFDSTGYYAMIFSQVTHRRIWREEDIEFLNAAAKQVEIAIQKIHLLNDRKQAELAIWEEKERAQVTLHSIGDAVITTDAAGTVDYLNPGAEDLTGWKVEEAKGQPLSLIFHIINEKTEEVLENPVKRCLQEGRIVGLANHTVLVHRDGHRFAIEDSAAPIRNSEGQIIGVVLVFHDVSEKRSLLQQMFHQSYHDPLTDLPNRIMFNDRLNRALAHAHRNNELATVMFLDLDRFKLVNDMLGHAMGDQLLKEVACRLSKSIRENDTIARFGGDEFTLLLQQINQEEDSAKVAQKILQSLEDPFVLSSHEFHVSASIGIVVYPNDGEDAETLMKHAETAMYRAKDEGRNNYQLFTPSMNARIRERLAMETSLRRALERQEFVVFYQPQVNIKAGTIKGTEALIRWQHPERGLVSPMEFIPLAEETGLIMPVGEWVLQTACAQNKAWQDAGIPPIRVTVNLSACQFQQKNLVEMITRVLSETGLAPKWLELEITESTAMQDVDFTISMLRDLREMGIRIAIDDFGTGYSSLNYLKRFPIHTLKIDRSFINDITDNREDAAIVTSIIVLAQNLNLKVIAEGVETEEQLSFLEQRQCYEMQGYLFSRPVPTSDFEVLLRQGNIM